MKQQGSLHGDESSGPFNSHVSHSVPARHDGEIEATDYAGSGIPRSKLPGVECSCAAVFALFAPAPRRPMLDSLSLPRNVGDTRASSRLSGRQHIAGASGWRWCSRSH